MIGHLRGLVKEKREATVTLECNGVGYEIAVPKSTPIKLPEMDESALLYTHLHVRPESHSLYGFLTVAERDMFRILINVNKIGPSLALNILSDLSIVDLIACVRYEDTKPLERVPRLGRATAAKLLIELSNKIDRIAEAAQLVDDHDVPAGDYLTDAIDALLAMGFTKKEARDAVAAVRDAADTAETLVHLALNSLGSTRNGR